MRQRPRIALVTAATVLLGGGGLTLLPATTVHAATSAARYGDDFNGDGHRDYASGGSGRVTVTYGTARGPGKRTASFDQDSPGIPGTPSRDHGDYEAFGDALAIGDFNRDGYGDLAVGDHSEDVDGKLSRGAVTLVWGSRSGLSSSATQLPHRLRTNHGSFGHALAAGDFDGDGKTDLAAAENESVFLYRGGFSTSGTSGKVTEHFPGEPGAFQPTALVAGKVTKDKITDLYVLGHGVEHVEPVNSGAWLLRGGPTIKPGELTTYSDKFNYQVTGVIADFDRNGYGDLAFREALHQRYAGSVLVLPGGPRGSAVPRRISQSTPGVATAATADDYFGRDLSAGDTNRDGYPDLAVGVPGEKAGAAERAGGVHILRGGKRGLTGSGSRWFTRRSAGVPGPAVEHEGFGAHVRLRDLDRDGDADLLVAGTTGSTVLLPGGRSGINASRARELPLAAGFPQ
ncbi:VCBS repeat-containing protein [Streptomyces sp. N2-109]|uniref:VCBS repeat-containing protein n=1 Tax=Streptomyces gossypii TaxID=2883101 RepID=A0ABT2JKZ6_9ACTN|nr:FG-GAP and VCBS repeat-containing protein [Streptomyces gossypii]MCT2588386.1 VCBS repeat-containing protein [Streptomyces gossypii]